ncbi:saccharopine dehydrogenase NADP-binding domain-containing protein [Streptomyces albiaxialis]|uniref:Saccharopine dehydrogenase NADP-binding domain-containing protein n=1 Tax=Streptomyces albiaxialis TaxID=329523 RepID=A0ABN2VU74_9ACTN
MSGDLTGIVGAYGDVGSHAARALHRAGARLRVGGRDARTAERFARSLGPGVEHRAVDFRDPAGADAFAAGLRTLVNCAGPSYAIGTRLAEAALRAEADYVDAAGDDALYARLDPRTYARAGRTAVLSAGLRPGLTGLFPRAVVREAEPALGEVRGLTVHTGVVDRFTEAAALDYLQGMADGLTRPLAAWREGGPRAGALTRRTGAELPFFDGGPGGVTVLPGLSTEDERLARALGLRHGDWYAVLCGDHVRAAFDRARSLERGEAVTALRRAALLDLADRAPSVTLVVTAEGEPDDGGGGGGGPGTLTAVLRGTGNAPLSGAVAAGTALAVGRGAVGPGRHYAADVLDAPRVLEALTGPDGPARLTWLGPGAAPFAAEEGAL